MKMPSGDKKKTRIRHLKADFEAGTIMTWEQVFDLYAKTTLAADLGIHFNSFMAKVANAGEFKIDEILALAKLLDLDYRIVLKFIINLTPAKQRPTYQKEPII